MKDSLNFTLQERNRCSDEEFLLLNEDLLSFTQSKKAAGGCRVGSGIERLIDHYDAKSISREAKTRNSRKLLYKMPASHHLHCEMKMRIHR